MIGWAASTLVGPVAVAQGNSALSIVPGLSITQTYTENPTTASSDRRAELVTQISPGVRITSRSGLLQGSFNYSANGLVYARDTQANAIHHQLAVDGSAQVVPGRFTVDATASVGQQVISAFGTQSVDPLADNPNRTQAASYSISPSLRGQLLGNVDYQTRLTYSGSHSGSSSVGDASNLSGTAGLSGRVGLLGWGVSASRSGSDAGNGARFYTGQVGGSLSMSPDVDWRFSLRAGHEVANLVGPDQGSTTTWGAGVAWSPGPRTSVSVDFDHRYFGQSHSLSFQHRFARTSFFFSDSRGVSNNGAAGTVNISLYDSLFNLLASQIPDPVARDVAVRNALRQQGLDPSTIVGGFLTSFNSIQRSQTLGATWQGLLATASVSAFQTRSTRILGVPAAGGDLDRTSEVRQFGYNMTVSYRLTPDSSVAVTGSQLTTPDSGGLTGNNLRSLYVNWSRSLGRHVQVSFGLRYARFEAVTNPYHEASPLGSLSLQF